MFGQLTGSRKTAITDEIECDQVVHDDWREAGATTLRSIPWTGYIDFLLKRPYDGDVGFEIEHERNARPRLEEDVPMPSDEQLEYSFATPAESAAQQQSFHPPMTPVI